MVCRNAGLLAVAVMLACGFSARGDETQVQYLSGHDKADAVAWDFTISGGDKAGVASTIKVPSNWELQGFGTLSYGREIPKGQSPGAITGHYKHTFTVPAEWAGKRVFIVFDGSMTDTAVRINGKSAGPTHQGGYYRFRYDISALLTYGKENTLEADVDQESANASVNNAERRGDYWNFAGIFRPVWLEALPQDAIDHVAINATADGKIAVECTGFNSQRPGPSQLDCVVLDADGKTVGAGIGLRNSQAEWIGNWNGQVANPKTWSAETPNLYTLQVSLKDQAGKVLHTIKQPFGFRTIEVRDGEGLFVNGQRVMLKGADRHSFWPDSGRCLSFDNMKADIAIMKEMNMNAVRCSHYPPNAEFLDFCDQQGMYVLDELAGWHAKYDDEVGHKLTKEMVDRDVNHPSILFWDNGNEGGWNNNLNGDFAKYDPQQRHVLHPWELFDHVDTKHYPSYTLLTQKLAGNNVYFPTEMIHGLFDGGAGAGLEDYWNAMLGSKVSAGGFIWALLDEGVKRPDTGEMDVRGNQAPDGILGPYREKEGSFYTIKQLWSPIMLSVKSSEQLPEAETLPDNFDGTLTLDNRYSFTNASQCSFVWELRKFNEPGVPGGGDKGYKVMSSGTAKADVAPLTKGTLKVNLPGNWKEASALAVRANGPDGKELWTFVYRAKASEGLTAFIGPGIVYEGPPKVPQQTETDTTLALALPFDAGTWTFDKKTGRLVSIKAADGTMSPLANGPRLVATGDVPDSPMTSFTYDAKKQVITATGDGPVKSITWNVSMSSEVTMEATYKLTGPHDYFGLGFDLPDKDIKSFQWMGNGPYRAYQNRIAGGSLGVWETAYNDTITGFRDWVYPECKGYYANVRWAQVNLSDGGRVTVVLQDDNKFLQFLTPTIPDQKTAGHAYVEYPKAGLSVMDAIPAMGTKFNAASTSGPQSQTAMANGEYHVKMTMYYGGPAAEGKK